MALVHFLFFSSPQKTDNKWGGEPLARFVPILPCFIFAPFSLARVIWPISACREKELRRTGDGAKTHNSLQQKKINRKESLNDFCLTARRQEHSFGRCAKHTWADGQTKSLRFFVLSALVFETIDVFVPPSMVDVFPVSLQIVRVSFFEFSDLTYFEECWVGNASWKYFV